MAEEIIRGLFLGPMYQLGYAVWEVAMALITGIATTGPEEFSSSAWNFVAHTLFPWSKGIAIILLNLFFFIGFYEEISNLKENLTTEIVVTHLLKVIVANAFILSSIPIIRQFFTMATDLTRQVSDFGPPSFAPENIDAGTSLFFFIFGVIYVLVAIICSGIMLLTVYGRYLKVYTIVVLAPIALSTMAGGRGIDMTAKSWFKTFLAYTFEIVLIMIVIAIAGKMIGSIDFGRLENALGEYMNGFGQCLQSMLCMILLAGAVKGTDTMMRRALAL